MMKAIDKDVDDGEVERERGKVKGAQCSICHKRLRSKYKLKLHMAVHTGLKEHVCTICDKGFQQKWNLVTHTERVHLKQKPFSCKDCGRTFGYSSHFRKHVLRTHFLHTINASDVVKNRIVNPYKCESCPRSFENKYRLHIHKQKHSSPQSEKHNKSIVHHVAADEQSPQHGQWAKDRRKELLACEVCGKSVRRYSMRKHLNVHTRARVYTCRFCGKQFLESSQLRTHERVHTGDKPYLCDVCGKAHAQYGNLLTHRNKYHSAPNKQPRLDQQDAQTQAGQDSVLSSLDTIVTGDETIQEFRLIADDWFKRCLVSSKSRGTVANIEGEEQEQGNTQGTDRESESEEDVPLAVLAGTHPKPEAGDGGCEVDTADADSTSSADHADPLPDGVGQVNQNEKKTRKIQSYRRTMNRLIFDKMCADEALRPFKRDVRAAMYKATERDALHVLLIRLRGSLPDNAVARHQQDGSTRWHCWECSAHFTTRHLLARHLLNHQPEDEWPYHCEYCNKPFTQSNNYKEHLLSHTKGCLYYCETCGHGFRHKTHFNKHIAGCSRQVAGSKGSPQKKHECEYCHKAFDSVFHKREHVRVHTKEKPYLCRICGDQFGACSTFIRHQRTHSDARHFQCPVCLKLFKEKSSLTRHKETHLGIKKYVCECGKCFSQSCSLNKHQLVCSSSAKRVHLKPHQCLLCTKRFLTKHDLKRHVATHNPARLYTCEVCHVKLKTKTTYQRHMGLHVLTH